MTTIDPIDPELWLQAAHTANDGEAVSWFANIHRTQEPTQEEHTSKQRWLYIHNSTTRWEHYLSSLDKLAMQHAQRARDIYCVAHTTETALQHLGELRRVYTNRPTAKTNYHVLVTHLPREHIEALRLQNAHTTMCLEHRRWYDHAKHDTMRHHAYMKTSLLSYEMFERLCTETDVLLAHHMQKAIYTWLRQECIVQLMQETASRYQQKRALYKDTSRQARQTAYNIRKRPREQRDCTLWEAPLQPLPKRQKVHSGPNEWEIPLT